MSELAKKAGAWNNIINTGYDRKEIIAAINKSLNDSKYIENCRKSIIPMAMENWGENYKILVI